MAGTQKQLAKAYVQIVPSFKGVKSSLSTLLQPSGSAAGAKLGQLMSSKFGMALQSGLGAVKDKIGQMMNSKFAMTLKSGLGNAGAKMGQLMSGKFGMALKAGLLAAAALAVKSLIDFTKEAVAEAGKLQQSMGGIETLYGEHSKAAKELKKNAWNAFKTAGMSANEYMETTTRFSAGLIRSLGGDTAKAAKISDMAIRDMSDNANKFGTDLSSVQDAYSGFARQNYTMLDNLNLGFAGTKQGMQDLLKYAESLTGKSYNIDNLSDVFTAIHEVQKHMKITGTTAKEASHTFEGSLNSMKSAWTNFQGALALGDPKQMQAAVQGLAISISTFIKNVIPLVINTLKGLGGLFMQGLHDFLKMPMTGMFDTIAKWTEKGIIWLLKSAIFLLFDLAPKLLLGILKLGWALLVGLATGIMNAAFNVSDAIWKVIDFILTPIANLINKLLTFGWNAIVSLAKGIASGVSSVVSAAVSIVQAIVSYVGQLASYLWNAGTSAVSSLWNALKSAVSYMYNLGRDIIMGIVQGISDYAGRIWSKLKSVVASAWKSAKKFLGINSPSRLFRDTIGSSISEGIAVGIEQSAGLAINSVKGLSQSLEDSFNPSLVLGDVSADRFTFNGSFRDHAPQVVQTININQPVSSPAEMARAMRRQAVAMGLAGGQAW